MANLLIIASTFPRWKNDSTPAFVYRIAKALAEKLKVVVLAPYSKGAKTQEKDGQLIIYRFKYWFNKGNNLADGGIMANLKKRPWLVIQVPFFCLAELIATIKLIKKEKITVIHAGWMIPQGLTALIINRFYKIKYLVTIFGGDMFPFKTNNRLWLWLYQLIIQKSSYVTTVNQAFLKYLNKIDDQKVIYIPNIVKIEKLKYKSKTKNILFVGRLVEKKGLKYLLEALTKIDKKQYQKLLVVGDGPLKNILEQQAVKLKLETKVKFLGNVNFNQLLKLYQESMMLVVPSIIPKGGDIEGFPTVYLDAMANNCPIVTTNIEGIESMIKNQQTGLVVEQKSSKTLAKAISLLINNQTLRDTLAKNALKEAKKKYLQGVVGEQYIKLIRNL